MLVKTGGFWALTASSAVQALQLMQEHPGICLVFTDLQMPGPLDGQGLIEELRSQGCTLPAILTSGLARPLQRLPSRTRFLAKPYRRDWLMQDIEALLAA